MSVFRDLAGGREDRCEFDHHRHDTLTVTVTLPDGACRPMTVFNWFRYETPTPGYCEGRDEVSKGIQHAGMWEANASQLVWGYLAATPGLVVDIGAHVGWYGILATALNCPYVAVDASVEHVEVLSRNVPTAARIRGWVGPDTPKFFTCPPIRLLKLDIEGNEPYALEAFRDVMRQIDAVLMEVTPPAYDAVEELIRRGYTGYALERGAQTISEMIDAGPATFSDDDGQANYFFIR